MKIDLIVKKPPSSVFVNKPGDFENDVREITVSPSSDKDEISNPNATFDSQCVKIIQESLCHRQLNRFQEQMTITNCNVSTEIENY